MKLIKSLRLTDKTAYLTTILLCLGLVILLFQKPATAAPEEMGWTKPIMVPIERGVRELCDLQVTLKGTLVLLHGDDSTAKILYSKDKGNKWQELKLDKPIRYSVDDFNNEFMFSKMCYLDGEKLYVLQHNEKETVLNKINLENGITETNVVFTKTILGNERWTQGFSRLFVSNNKIYLVQTTEHAEQEQIFFIMSTDDGKSWSKISHSDVGGMPNFFVSGKTLNIIYKSGEKQGHKNKWVQSVDDGKTWKPKDFEFATVPINIVGMQAPDENTYIGIYHEEDPIVYFKSSDQGKTWKKLNKTFLSKENEVGLHFNLKAVGSQIFLTFVTVFIEGRSPAGMNSHSFISKDGGETWEEINVSPDIKNIWSPVITADPKTKEIYTAFMVMPPEKGENAEPSVFFSSYQKIK